MNNKQYSTSKVTPLPTRTQLVRFLQRKGISPDRLKQMTAREQVQLVKEYQQAAS